VELPAKEVAAENIKCFRGALEALRFLNLEFLSRTCDCVTKMISVPASELDTNALKLDCLVKAMREQASGGEPDAPLDPSKFNPGLTLPQASQNQIGA